MYSADHAPPHFHAEYSQWSQWLPWFG
jgi:hypothetical protein